MEERFLSSKRHCIWYICNNAAWRMHLRRTQTYTENDKKTAYRNASSCNMAINRPEKLYADEFLDALNGNTTIRLIKNRWLGWRTGNGCGHTNTTSSSPVSMKEYLPLAGVLPSRYFSQPLRPTQPGHPYVGRCNEYRWQFRPLLGKKH